MHKLLRLSVALCSLLAALPAQHRQSADTKASKPGTVVELAVAAGSFRTLVAALQAAELVDTLAGKGPFTIFAPTDGAFAKLGKDAVAELLLPENKAKLTAVLTLHVVGANLPAAKVFAQKTLTSLQGSPLAIDVADDTVTVGGAKVVQTDILGSNGVIHVIDSVLLPPANLVEVASKAGSFGTLLKAATAAGLADTLANGGPFTVFAPTDAAFAKLGRHAITDLLKPANKDKLAAILKHHVVAGRVSSCAASKVDSATTLLGDVLALHVADGRLTVDGAAVITADVAAGNGVIHVIDAVLLPKQ